MQGFDETSSWEVSLERGHAIANVDNGSKSVPPRSDFVKRYVGRIADLDVVVVRTEVRWTVKPPILSEPICSATKP